ncbi:AAA domain containing protein [uncultured Caudovirales phage]|uniref:AAA domain containing protein n=1 Tax=uncultured Caudovirales phage TaxID=2100421 RepID=A0A6J5RGX3_9CAUD|nr:AAA domain containing protein [uncultured Caudovirales phage]
MAMRITSYEAHNIQRVRDIKFDLEGRNLFLVGGKNGMGKSSALMGIAMAICGKLGMDDYPKFPLREGEQEGYVKIGLSGSAEELHEPDGLTLELKLIRKRDGLVAEEFRVLDSTGEEAAEPRTTMKRLYQTRGFDPLSFARQKPESQRVLLEKMTKLDFTAEREQYQKLFEQRTDVNRNKDAAKARFDGFTFYPDVEERSAVDLMEKIDELSTINSENAKKRSAADLARETLRSDEESITSVREQIEQLQKRLQTLTANVESQRHHVAEQDAIVASLADHDLAPLRAKMKTIESDNFKARSNAKREEALKQYNELANKSDAMTETLKEIVETQKKRLAEAKFPVPGMSLAEKGILLNGLPFEQSSKAQRIMASVDIAIALNPTLRLMICEDGNDLDDETIAALDKKLEETGFQMIVELATRSTSDEDLCAVVIKDGKVAKTNPVKTKKPAAGLFEGDEADVDNTAAV